MERGHTCYGPGDRVSVVATLKCQSVPAITLAGFELSIRESTTFRAGPSGAPTVKHLTISETKLPVNATLYGGMQHKAKLVCGISPNHATTTLSAASHIDITYVLSVKALMSTGRRITIDLPAIVSDQPRSVVRGRSDYSELTCSAHRNVSHEAIR